VARRRLEQAGIRACYFLQLGYPGETFGDIAATQQLVRETLPDAIGVSVSYPLPGTRFHAMVAASLGAKDHWDDSADLAMMFQGTYQTAFYRELRVSAEQPIRCLLKISEFHKLIPTCETLGPSPCGEG